MIRNKVRTRVSFALASVMSLALLIAPGSASGARTAGDLVRSSATVAQTAELTASDGAVNDVLGTAVAISGSIAVVGAPSHTVGSNAGQGAAYVFSNASGAWKQITELTASDGAAGNAFGSSVAISGTTIVVGAPNRAYGGAYVFTNTTGSWKQVAEIYDPSQKVTDQFGFSVAISGSTIVVGTLISPAGTTLEGAVYVFSNANPSGNWQQTSYLTLATPASYDEFGYSVAVSGTTLVVGAPLRSRTGAAYVFTDGAGGWTQTSTLTATDAAEGDYFGLSVAVLGSNVVVGAPYKPVGSNSEQGEAYVFNGGSQVAEFSATSGAADDLFGWSVSTSTGNIVVGAPGLVTNTGSQGVGGVYQFGNSSGTWKQTSRLSASDGAVPDGLGNSVAISGTAVLAGAPGHKVGTKVAQGAAYLYSGNPGSIDWDMPARVALGKSGLNAEGLPPASYVYPASWVPSLFLDDNGVRVTSCPTGYTWKWTVAVVSIPSGVTPTITGPTDGCTSAFTTTALGTYKVTAEQYQMTSSGLTSTGLVVTNNDVVINDVLIVGLGDSNGSGEGDLPFYDTQCDRGVASEQYQAADGLEAQFKGHTSVTFVADACSGARTQDLYPDSYVGVHKGAPLPPQITALTKLIADHGSQPARKVDAAFVSAGINNIGFGPLLEVCIQLKNACESIPMEPDYANGVVTGFTTYPGTKDPTLKEWIAKFTDLLPARYEGIAPMLKELVAPDRTFISDYPTFVYPTDNKEEVCSNAVSPHFKTSTWEWLKGAASALNAEVNKTSKLGWRPVVVNPYLFLGHGYCAGSKSWFVTLGRAIWNNLAGAFHATSRGALVTAELNVAAVCPVVAKASECKDIKTPVVP